MITRQRVANIVNEYDLKNIKTVCICQKGRELPYQRFKRLTDEIILLDKFSDMLNREIQEKLVHLNTIMIANRAFTAYLGYDNIENNLEIPIFGNRHLLRAEERTAKRNQYFLLEKANIRHPRIFTKSLQIDGLAMVKVQEAKRKLERA